jgi:hypothetical protein
MNRQQTLDQVYGILCQLRATHPHGLRAIGDANAHHVLTRFGVAGDVAEMCSIILESLTEYGGMQNPIELIEFLREHLNPDGTMKQPSDYDCAGVKPGEKDEHGLHTHPDLMFTAPNWNGRRFAIEADASPRGLSYYQEWRNADEIAQSGVTVLRAWDATEGRYLTDPEIQTTFNSSN